MRVEMERRSVRIEGRQVAYEVTGMGAELTRQDVRPLLASVHVPTLVIWGEHDALVPLSVGELLHAEIEGSRLVVIPGAGHVPMHDDPRSVSDAILEFLASSATTT
jgi:pimeloyl-ACP methyl ester carboxylesterase